MDNVLDLEIVGKSWLDLSLVGYRDQDHSPEHWNRQGSSLKFVKTHKSFREGRIHTWIHSHYWLHPRILKKREILEKAKTTMESSIDDHISISERWNLLLCVHVTPVTNPSRSVQKRTHSSVPLPSRWYGLALRACQSRTADRVLTYLLRWTVNRIG